MAKITRIKASDGPSKAEESDAPAITRKKVVVKDKKTEKTKRAEIKKAKKAEKQTDGKKTFILFRPFVAFFRYLRDSWREIRQVRWPNRKATWKMVLAVLVYTALFIIIISLLDLFFTWLFSLILK
ncbi:preprotein translocase subunit SecE [Candidatus Saccharibacteria bacterium]|nr:preprotein translocase subunit SecE [Candidatus Saccharibacteria bacterium]MBR3332474.1 preprotein translocase subunit SecE [Candidatus Saccharibacteria bacterium]